jgi:hypothetical protein
MADQLVGGQRFRLLTRVDNHSRESLAIEVGQRRTRDDGALGNRTPSKFARPLSGHAQITALHGSQLGWYQVGGGVRHEDSLTRPGSGFWEGVNLCNQRLTERVCVIDPVTKKPLRKPLLSAIRRGLRSRGSGRSRTDDGGFAIRCLSHLATEPWYQPRTERYGKLGGMVKVCALRSLCRSCRTCRTFRPRLASAIWWLGLQLRCFAADSGLVWPLSQTTDRVSAFPKLPFPPGVFRG